MSAQSAQGLDVSNYQGQFDWSAVTGLSFGIYRMTQGLGVNTNSPDPDAVWNNAQLEKHSLIRGSYHFFNPKLSGEAQAQYFVTQRSLIGLDGSDMLWLDHETAGPSPAETSAAAVAFMTELDKLAPHNPRGVYTYISFATCGNCAGLDNWPLWLAYPAADAPVPPPPWAKWTFWQWGLRNGVDSDAFNGTPADLQAWIASYATPGPQAYDAPPSTSIAALAKQHDRTVPEVIWLTAHNRAQGFGLMETAYIAAGNWDAPMPVGMTVWA
jgi:GH25 family lysozyme M1 (1,4-beta-N-acetylmuramidase)